MSVLLFSVGVGLLSVAGTVYYFFCYKKCSSSLKGKVVLIVGASSGIGEACAHIFYKENCKLILCAKDLPDLERVKKEVEESYRKTDENCESTSEEVTIFQLDISNLNETTKKISECIQIHGHIDILLGIAGISFRGKIIETELSVDQLIMSVNYFGHVAATKAVLKSMVERRSGHIVYMSSLQGKLSIPFRSAYSASKHAIQAFADCLRAEVAQFNVRVSVVSPAYVRTNLSLNALTSSGSLHGKMDENQKSGMSAEEVGQAVVQAVLLDKKEVLLANCSYKMIVYFRNFLSDIYFMAMARRARSS
ncbi:hypothetical protein HELRODRAFT_194864 [Helobdella robusta]|uniref:Uncharacterized protein n=1 Tax=Helobdella robusta TaxID=6412 RepID=T1FWI0_HELRO|nr:hypothetical protein HELRODRAFT_194864 [Helobdella robusta]ESO11327.1 hypothetical protein HELRODRAFT_194864 [Helobdella robusta]